MLRLCYACEEGRHYECLKGKSNCQCECAGKVGKPREPSLFDPPAPGTELGISPGEELAASGRAIPQHKSLAAIGAEEDLDPGYLRQLNAQVERVFDLMKDGEWHTAEEVRVVAGGPDGEASEGTRRLRALYVLFTHERRRVSGTRMFEYRLTGMRRAAPAYEVCPHCGARKRIKEE